MLASGNIDGAIPVRRMFDQIAHRYDLMNELMSLGQVSRWSRFVASAARVPAGGKLLDIGVGTGKIAFEAIARDPTLTVVGVDFALEMMQVGRKTSRGGTIFWGGADALHLPFADRTFDAVVSGYLIRNVSDRLLALREQLRVLKPGGRMVCLDTSPPRANSLKPLIGIYLNGIIPLMGWLVAGNRQAYQYLPQSTEKFLTPDALARVIASAGFRNVRYRRFLFGAVAVHRAVKPQ